MNLRSVSHVVASICAVIGFFILSAVPVAFFMGDGKHVLIELTFCGLLPVVLAAPAFYATRPRKHTELGVREGFGIVTFGWIAASVVGAIPFYVVSDLNWYDAFFETMSGFSTTGASVLSADLELKNNLLLGEAGIQALPKGLLYWRSMTHWLGGMGIVVLSLAILPFLGIGGQSLYNAEVPGPTSDQLTPRIANSAKILWGVYVLLSVLQTLALYAGGMSLFDAWCHTCGTMATGGFSTQQASIGQYNSPYFDYVITLFMFLAGCNFVLHYRALRGKPLFYFKDEEFRFYSMLTLAAAVTITAWLMISKDPIITTAGEQLSPTLATAFRFSLFQVVSILTTTGFCTADFDLWPIYAQLLLVALMFVGGCGGSTGGGMKNSRLLLLLKYGKTQLRRCLFPNCLSNVRLSGIRVSNSTVHKTLGFFFLFISLYFLFSIVLTFVAEIDLGTASTASIACLGNIGPGLAGVGATCSYGWLPASAKLILSFAMLLGRLELFTVLVILLPSFWKK